MDPISNMIIQIKNAGAMNKESVVLTHSSLKMSILDALAKAGFVTAVTKKGKKVVKYIEVTLAYDQDAMGQKRPKISDVKRISKSSKRVYIKANVIRPVRSGYGIMILSTPKGILTDKQAREQKVGGEALFTAW